MKLSDFLQVFCTINRNHYYFLLYLIWDRKLLWKPTSQAAGPHRSSNSENMPARTEFVQKQKREALNCHGKAEVPQTLTIISDCTIVNRIPLTSPKLPCKENKILVDDHHLQLGGKLAKAWEQLTRRYLPTSLQVI